MKIVILKDKHKMLRKNTNIDSDFTDSDSELNYNKQELQYLSNEITNYKSIFKTLSRGGLRAFVFNVGQGNFNMVYDAENKAMYVFDVGGSYEYPTLQPTKIKFFNNPYDYSKGPLELITNMIEFNIVNSIDIFISHNDIDHYILLPKLIEILINPKYNDLYNPEKYFSFTTKELLRWKVHLNPLLQGPNDNNLKDLSKINVNNLTEKLIEKYGLFEVYKQLRNYYGTINWETGANEHFKVIPEGLSKFGNTIQIFRPSLEKLGNFRDSNDGCAIIKYVKKQEYKLDSAREISVIFPGDATQITYNALFKHLDQDTSLFEKFLQCDVLIANHHGADNAIDQQNNFWKKNIKNHNPSMVVYSAALNSQFGHPRVSGASQVLAHLDQTKNIDTIRVPYHQVTLGSQKIFEDENNKPINNFNIQPVEGNNELILTSSNITAPTTKIRGYITNAPIFHTGAQGSILISSSIYSNKTYPVLRLRSYDLEKIQHITEKIFNNDRREIKNPLLDFNEKITGKDWLFSTTKTFFEDIYNNMGEMFNNKEEEKKVLGSTLGVKSQDIQIKSSYKPSLFEVFGSNNKPKDTTSNNQSSGKTDFMRILQEGQAKADKKKEKEEIEKAIKKANAESNRFKKDSGESQYGLHFYQGGPPPGGMK